MYGFDYFNGTLSVTFHLGVNADNVTTPLRGGMPVGRQGLSSGSEVLLLCGSDLLESMQQLLVEDIIRWVQKQILVRLVVQEDMVVVSEATGIKLS